MAGDTIREIMAMVRALGVPASISEAIESLITAHAIKQVNSARIVPMPGVPANIGELARAFHKRALRRSEITGDCSDDLTWHMLLSLTAEDASGSGVLVSTLCMDSGGPQTTALRHISGMVERGLVTRHPDRRDGRRIWIRLTDTARDKMHAMLLDFCMPCPIERPPPPSRPIFADDEIAVARNAKLA